MPFIVAAVVSSAVTGAASASSISIRSVARIPARLCHILLQTAARADRECFKGVAAGSACQSGSSLNTAARISVVVSP